MSATTLPRNTAGADELSRAKRSLQTGEPSDHELIKQAHAGDQRAMELLLDRYRSFARYKVRHYFIPGAEDEDLLQEAMVGLFSAVRDYDLEGDHLFIAFADLCIQRQILTAIKKANRLKQRVLNGALRLDGSSSEREDDHPLISALQTRPCEDPSRTVEAADQIDRVRGFLLQALTKIESDALNLSLEGKTYDEMAEILGLRVKGIDNALQRARTKLQTFLDADRANIESSTR